MMKPAHVGEAGGHLQHEVAPLRVGIASRFDQGPHDPLQGAERQGVLVVFLQCRASLVADQEQVRDPHVEGRLGRCHPGRGMPPLVVRGARRSTPDPESVPHRAVVGPVGKGGVLTLGRVRVGQANFHDCCGCRCSEKTPSTESAAIVTSIPFLQISRYRVPPSGEGRRMQAAGGAPAGNPGGERWSEIHLGRLEQDRPNGGWSSKEPRQRGGTL